MSNLDSFSVRWTPRLLSVLRIIAAFILMLHGAQKLFGFLPIQGMPASFPTFSLPWIAGVLEFFGGLLLLIGLFTRPVAFVLSGLMAVAYFMAHAPQGFWPLQVGGNGGELAVLYCFICLFIAAAGGGEWAVDRLIHRGRTV
jgi:putative oxidoreductase